MVVISDEKAIGSSLTFGGGPGGSGVGGSLTLRNEGTSPGNQHVSITGGSTLTISSTAYNALQPEYKTADTLKIGASESDERNPDNAEDAGGLNKEDSFKKYWHLLPPNNI